MGSALFRFSSKQPSDPASEPETVPVARRSPVRRLQPLLAWCATSCAMVQYKLHSERQWIVKETADGPVFTVKGGLDLFLDLRMSCFWRPQGLLYFDLYS